MGGEGERRQAPRVPVELRVAFRHLGRPSENYAEMCRDLSEGGVFVETSVTLEVGTLLELEISAGPNIRPIRLCAEVVRVEDPLTKTGSRETQRIRGMALRFLDPDPKEHGRLTVLAKHSATKESHGNRTPRSR